MLRAERARFRRFFGEPARTCGRLDTLIDIRRNFCAATGYRGIKMLEVSNMMQSRPSRIRLLAAVPSFAAFALRANERSSSALAGKERRL